MFWLFRLYRSQVSQRECFLKSWPKPAPLYSTDSVNSQVWRLIEVIVVWKRHAGGCVLASEPECSVCSGFPQQECALGSGGNGTTETTRCVSTFSWEHELLRQTLGRRCFFCVCVCVRWIWKSCTCSTMESEMWTVSVKTRGESEASTFHASRSIWDLTPNMAGGKKKEKQNGAVNLLSWRWMDGWRRNGGETSVGRAPSGRLW